MNEIIVGAFYTKNSEYERIYRETLLPSIKKFNIPYIAVETREFNNWQRNVAEKPKAILDLLNSNFVKDKLLVFLDVDAEIVKAPKLFYEIPETAEIGFHVLDWNTWYGYKSNPPMKELLTGTMFFRNTEGVKELCKDWYEAAVKNEEWEQKCLQKLIVGRTLVIYQLPLEYIYIKTMPRGGEPLVKLDPVIVHYQASRELKKKINAQM